LENGAENMLSDFYVHPRSIDETLKVLDVNKAQIFKDNLKTSLTYSWQYNVNEAAQEYFRNIPTEEGYISVLPSPIVERMNSPYKATEIYLDPEKRINKKAREVFRDSKIERKSRETGFAKNYGLNLR